MPKYIMRLDDACERMDVEKWDKMEALLDNYGIKPLVGVIPHCEDPMMEQYPVDETFWDKVHRWEEKGWIIALHGYNHVYSTECGGINPIHKRSEFAGEPLMVQKDKIRKGVSIFREHGLEPKVFFAPSHTFDKNTLVALKEDSNIRLISDTVAWDCFREGDFTFVPQQCGTVRGVPFKTCTFCYHPNVMGDPAFQKLERFVSKSSSRFLPFDAVRAKRHITWVDRAIRSMYFFFRKTRGATR